MDAKRLASKCVLGWHAMSFRRRAWFDGPTTPFASSGTCHPWNLATCHPLSSGRFHPRRAFSLLEVILALTLATVLIGLLLLATRTFLQVGEETKYEVERATLARNVLQLIARDLQNIVVPAAQDVSGLSTAALPEGAELEAAAAGSAGTGSSGSNGGGGSNGGNSNSSGGSGGQASGSEGNSSSNGSDSSSGSASSDDDSADESSSSTSSEVTDSTSLDVPGVYGNRYQLVFDILRTPEFNPYAAAANGASSAPQRVSWSVVSGAGAFDSETLGANTTSLVRQSQSRAAASWANTNGQTQGSASAPLSSRVAAIEFRYFDGTQWLETWDSAQQEALPVAIEAAVLVLSSAEASSEEVGNSLAGTNGTSAMFAGAVDAAAISPAGKIYRRVVYLPLSGLSPTAAAAAAASEEEVGADEAESSEGTSGAGTAGTGGTGSSGGRGGSGDTGSSGGTR